jgi:hypothetical protein
VKGDTDGEARGRRARSDTETAGTWDVMDDAWFGRLLKRGRSLLLLMISYLVAVGVVMRWFLKEFLVFQEQSPGAFWAIVLGPLLFIAAFESFPRLLQVWRRKRRDVIALEPVPASLGYFRLDPYVKSTPADFSREDGAHERVLQWIRTTDQPVLFLSGASGAGKSSVLEGYVLPTLHDDGWRVIEVRGFTDPARELENALSLPRRRGTCLLVVFDQFEEFIILEREGEPDQRQRFLTRVRELGTAPPHGVCVLFAFRTEYQSAVEALDLGELRSRSTWTEIAPFGRGAARRFLEGAPQRPSTALVDQLLDGADELDDSPRLYRPVTLNMLGVALLGFDRTFTGRPERLVQAYLEDAIAEKPIRDVAPRVIKEMITDATTKQAQSVADLSTATGLRAPDVSACLNRLAAKGLARRLGGTAALWELSHDFVARQFALLLGRLRPSPWPRIAAVASPALFPRLRLQQSGREDIHAGRGKRARLRSLHPTLSARRQSGAPLADEPAARQVARPAGGRRDGLA